MAFGIAPVALRAEPSREALATVVLFNSADEESKKLADYYAERREIPSANVLALACPLTEEISRQEFVSTIAVPLRSKLIKGGFWSEDPATGRIISTKVRFVAVMRGIPLKVRADETVVPDRSQPGPIGTKNEASVDSELMALGYTENRPAGVLGNPYYRRFTPVLDLQGEPEILLVGRLDAPDSLTVRAMIDDSLTAERDGLWGWGYVDARGLTSGPLAEGDKWLTEALNAMRKQGIPCLMDSSQQLLPAGFPITDAAVYYGWYAPDISGALADPLLRFKTGAIAAHLHSFSATTLRALEGGWCGPLLVRGAAATVGNVYEPYLTLTTELGVMQDRLMAGLTFAESAWTATRALSWMNIVVGDPLYRPYAGWRPGANASSGKDWEEYRRIVRVRAGDVVAAAKELKSAARATGNSLFLEALAAAQLDAGDPTGALRSVQDALTMEKRKDVRFRLGLEEYAILRGQGETRAAARVLSRVAGEDVSPSARKLLAQFYEDMAPDPGPTPKMR